MKGVAAIVRAKKMKLNVKKRIISLVMVMFVALGIVSEFGLVVADDTTKNTLATDNQEYSKIEFYEKIKLPKSPDSANMVLMIKEGQVWSAQRMIPQLCESWDFDDEIIPVDTGKIILSFKNNRIFFVASEKYYSAGNVAEITVRNKTKNMMLDIPVNFTVQEQIPTFVSWGQAVHYIDNIARRSDNEDVAFVDPSLRQNGVVTEDVIRTFDSIAKNRLEAYRNQGFYDPAVVSTGRVDNTGHFFALTENKGRWSVSLRITDIDPEWEGDIISVESVFEVQQNNDVITFSYEGDSFQEGETIIVLLENKSKNVSSEIFLNFSHNGLLAFTSEEKAHLFGVWEPNYIVVEPSANSPKNTTQNTRYKIYKSNGTLYSNTEYSNPFIAIRYVASNNLVGYSVKQTNDSATVFTYQPTVTTTFYKFQFTQYYGLTNASGALQWYNNYDYIHIVRADGIFGANTQSTDNQPYSHSHIYYGNTPATWLLEGNTGGYVAVHALSYCGYRVMKGTVKLSNAQLDKAGMAVNPYAFMTSATSNTTCDLGLIYINNGYSTAGWYLCMNRNRPDLGTNPHFIPGALVTPASSPVDIELTYTYETDKVKLTAKNLSTNVMSHIQDISSYYNTDNTYVGLAAITSFVPSETYNSSTLRIVGDIKSGAYFKNVEWNDIRVATSINSNYVYLNPSSTQINTIIVFDTDSTSCTFSGNSCTVDIWYDSTYK